MSAAPILGEASAGERAGSEVDSMINEDRARAEVIDGLASDIETLGGPSIRHLQQRIAALEGEIRGIRCFTTPDGAQYDLTDINYVLDLIHKAECSELNQTHAERAERELAEKQARLLNVAKGCHDYGGGYRGVKVLAEVYHHGIQTVINALESAIREPDSTQVRALERAAIDAARRADQEPRLCAFCGHYEPAHAQSGTKPCQFREGCTCTAFQPAGERRAG